MADGPFDFLDNLLAPIFGPASGPQGGGPETTGALPAVSAPQAPRPPLPAQPLGDPSDMAGRGIRAIRRIEQDARGYQTLGPVIDNPNSQHYGTQALGAYGIMPRNLPQWLREAGLPQMNPAEFLANPEAQDTVARHRFQVYLDRFGGNVQDAAQAWFAGPDTVGRPEALGRNDATRRTRGTSVATYRRIFQQYFDRDEGPEAAPGGSVLASAAPTAPAPTPSRDVLQNPFAPSGVEPTGGPAPYAPTVTPAPRPAPTGPMGGVAAAISGDRPRGLFNTGLGDTWSLIGTPMDILFGPNAALTAQREQRGFQRQQSEAMATIMGRVSQLQAQSPDMPPRALLNQALADPHIIRAMGRVPPGEMVKMFTEMTSAIAQPRPELRTVAPGGAVQGFDEQGRPVGTPFTNPEPRRAPSERFEALLREVIAGRMTIQEMNNNLGGGRQLQMVADPITGQVRWLIGDTGLGRPIAGGTITTNGEVITQFGPGMPGAPGAPGAAAPAAPARPPAPGPGTEEPVVAPPATPPPAAPITPAPTPPAAPIRPPAPGPTPPQPTGPRRADMFNAAGWVAGARQQIGGFLSNFIRLPSGDQDLQAQSQQLASLQAAMARAAGSTRLRRELEVALGQFPSGWSASPMTATIWGLGLHDYYTGQVIRLRSLEAAPTTSRTERQRVTEDRLIAENVLAALPSRQEIVQKLDELRNGARLSPLPNWQEMSTIPGTVTRSIIDMVTREDRPGQAPAAPGTPPAAPSTPPADFTTIPTDRLLEMNRTVRDPAVRELILREMVRRRDELRAKGVK